MAQSQGTTAGKGGAQGTNMSVAPTASYGGGPGYGSNANKGGGQSAFHDAGQAQSAALQGTHAGLNYSPMMIDPASFGGGGGYNAATSNANVNAQSYDPTLLRDQDISSYMNPYTQNVIDTSLADIERARAMQQNTVDAQLGSAGAFGGSRHGIANAENNRNFLDQSARTSAQLQNMGYQNAQQAALTDVGALNRGSEFNAGQDMQAQMANMQNAQFNAGARNQAGSLGAQLGAQAGGRALQAALANQSAFQTGMNTRLGAAQQLGLMGNQSFNYGQAAQQGNAAQGNLVRGLEQGVIDAARQQFGMYTGQPYQDMQMLNQTLSGLPMPSGQTSTSTPGLLDWAGTGLQGYATFAALSSLGGPAAGAGAAGAAAGTSDIALKQNVELIGSTFGVNLYEWEWTDQALQLAANGDIPLGDNRGVIAQEVQEDFPDAVITDHPSGFLMVNYKLLASQAADRAKVPTTPEQNDAD